MSVELDPNSIVVRDRQRKKIENVDDHFIKSVNERLIHPIVLRRDGDDIVLVVGGRRLEALKQGKTSPLIENTHFRFLENLSPEDARIAELEENVKRDDLDWRDMVNAVAELHATFSDNAPDGKWDAGKTGARLNISRTSMYETLSVYKHLDKPVLREATGVKNALAMLRVNSERQIGELVDDLTAINRQQPKVPPIAQAPSGSPEAQNAPSDPAPNPGLDRGTPIDIGDLGPEPAPVDLPGSTVHRDPVNGSGASQFILNTDSIRWMQNYTGPKFNLIHCDFPYDIRYDSYAKSITSTQDDYDFSGFWPLADALVENIDKIFSYSGHIMFWFSMKFYSETKRKLEEIPGLFVHDHPLVWLKSDNTGIIPGRDNAFPRRIYETAFLCTRGRKPLVKSLANAYAAPTARDPIHPSQKPEPVLRFFFGALVDVTTDFLDPTAGSGSSVRAAESCKARRSVGIELNEAYAKAAESACQNHHRMLNIRL